MLTNYLDLDGVSVLWMREGENRKPRMLQHFKCIWHTKLVIFTQSRQAIVFLTNKGPSHSLLHPRLLDSRRLGRPAWKWRWVVWSRLCAQAATSLLASRSPTCPPPVHARWRCTHLHSSPLHTHIHTQIAGLVMSG